MNMDKNQKVLTVAIIGAGSRGADSYGKIMNEDPRFKIVSVCDKRQVKLDAVKERFKISDDNLFLDEKEFFAKKSADICIVATQDKDHVRHCIAALKAGYDVLLEKPITDSKEECEKLLATQKQYGGKVVVCHVLRYAQAFLAASKLIDEGKIGKLTDIQAIEQVAFWHQAHSYVRGNWRRSEDTSPMIMAKCCHDMDLLQFYAKSKFKTVSSIGSLSFFKKENQPKGAADHCKDCPYLHTCPYSAEKIYVDWWIRWGRPKTMWPMNVICTDEVLTEEGIRKAYENGPYGRCVFACDNDVVDHQETNILFENGVTANLCMTAFTGDAGRIYRFHGTYGELDLNEEKQCLVLKVYDKPTETIPFNALPDVSGGHGGGDAGLVNALYDIVTGKKEASTALENSLESHLMAIAAEESRLQDGKLIKR